MSEKLHEHDWSVQHHDGRTYVVSETERMVCETRQVDGPEVGQFIAAAPAMARALLTVLKEHGATMPHTASEIEDILRLAGVLPERNGTEAAPTAEPALDATCAGCGASYGTHKKDGRRILWDGYREAVVCPGFRVERNGRAG